MSRKSVRRVIPVCVLVLALAGCTLSHAPKYTFEAASLDPGSYVARVDAFQIVVDDSLSMADRYGHMRKYDTAAGVVNAMAMSIPEVGFASGVRSFGQGKCVSRAKKTDLLVGMAPFSGNDVATAVDSFDCAAGNSPLDEALSAARGDLGAYSGDMAVVIVSDGMHMGAAEISEAEQLKQAFGERICLYPVVVGNDRQGRELLQKIADVGGCGFLMDAADLTSAAAMQGFVEKVFVERDSDGDGVADSADQCPNTPSGVKVDSRGCALDSDGDGVPDHLDKCPNTLAGVKVNASGCPVDSDGDGVPDHLDKCPGTPRGVKVDARGCPVDSDVDGVTDDKDKCPGTPAGTVVDKDGCAIEGISKVGDEWFVEGKVLFDLNASQIKPEAHSALNFIADYLSSHPAVKLEVQGHTDKSGPRAYNDKLSQARAEAARAYLEGKGVDGARMTATGFAWDEPLVPNDSQENRAKNRRVDFLQVK